MFHKMSDLFTFHNWQYMLLRDDHETYTVDIDECVCDRQTMKNNPMI